MGEGMMEYGNGGYGYLGMILMIVLGLLLITGVVLLIMRLLRR